MSTATIDPLLCPVLSAAHIDMLTPLGTVEAISVGNCLIEQGSREFDFFVVLSGGVGIFDVSGDNHLVVTHTAGYFVGDTDMLSSRAAVIRAEVTQAGQVLRIPFANLKAIVARSAELSEIILNAFLLRRAALMADTTRGIKLIGSRYSRDTFRIREFFSRNNLPYQWLDVETDPGAAALLEQFNVPPHETPILIAANKAIYRNPSNEQIAACTGVTSRLTSEVMDLVVVGAGPAGLAASVYAASEGLSVLTVDSVGPGGQAGTSSRIENYLGFPTGISGSELASRAYIQAQKFGCEISIPSRATALQCEGALLGVTLQEGKTISTRSVVIATGARYRKLNLPNISDYEGQGIYYGATYMEAQTCGGQDVVLVGGGNSAGQGAMFLAKQARHVHLVIRGADLTTSMSRYLIERIENEPNITLHPYTEVTALAGEEHLTQLTLTQRKTGESQTIPTSHLFVFIGADPCTAWVGDCVALDAKGFVLTGDQIGEADLKKAGWSLPRRPSLLETSLPGVFAVGDVRSGSTKRVASSVGEGSMAVSHVHQFLASL